MKHIALQHGVKRQTFSYRRSKGWSVEEASTTPPLSRAESLRRANLLNNNNTVFTREELQQIDKTSYIETLYIFAIKIEMVKRRCNQFANCSGRRKRKKGKKLLLGHKQWDLCFKNMFKFKFCIKGA